MRVLDFDSCIGAAIVPAQKFINFSHRLLTCSFLHRPKYKWYRFSPLLSTSLALVVVAVDEKVLNQRNRSHPVFHSLVIGDQVAHGDCSGGIQPNAPTYFNSPQNYRHHAAFVFQSSQVPLFRYTCRGRLSAFSMERKTKGHSRTLPPESSLSMIKLKSSHYHGMEDQRSLQAIQAVST